MSGSQRSDAVLVLKVVREDMTSYQGFKWPESGKVTPKEWTTEAECGNGLHGWLNGEGSYRHEFMEGKWIVFEADPKDVIWRGTEKVKVKEGNVIFCGSRVDAVKLLIERGALTDRSKPGTCCFTPAQLVELAYRATNRAKKHAASALRSTKQPSLIKHAEKIEATKDVTDQTTASEACVILRNAADAADAAYYAADAADAAKKAADAADAAYYAGNAAYNAADAAKKAADAAYNAANYAAYNAAYYAAYNAAYYAANAANAAKKAEEEEQRLDRLELLGFKVRQ